MPKKQLMQRVFAGTAQTPEIPKGPVCECLEAGIREFLLTILTEEVERRESYLARTGIGIDPGTQEDFVRKFVSEHPFTESGSQFDKSLRETHRYQMEDLARARYRNASYAYEQSLATQTVSIDRYLKTVVLLENVQNTPECEP